MPTFFRFKALQNLPKFGCLVWKHTTWQPCIRLWMQKLFSWWGLLMQNLGCHSVSASQIWDQKLTFETLCHLKHKIAYICKLALFWQNKVVQMSSLTIAHTIYSRILLVKCQPSIFAKLERRDQVLFCSALPLLSDPIA
jgi:hypothetical protein